MTSNQVANAANQINERQVAENERHNASVEEETKRHNLATEGIQAQLAKIEEEKNHNEIVYKQDALAWQKEYERAYLEWQRANGQRKNDLEAELNGIKARQQQQEAWYQQEMIRLNQASRDLQSELQAEQERNNKALEGLKAREIATTEYKNWLTEKNNQYMWSYYNASIAAQNLGLQIQRENNLNNYNLGLMNAEIGQTNAAINAFNLRLQIPKVRSEEFRNYVNAVSDMFKAGTSVVGSFRLFDALH